jgi:hypothetical protein
LTEPTRRFALPSQGETGCWDQRPEDDLAHLTDQELESLCRLVGRRVVQAGDRNDGLLVPWFCIWDTVAAERERRDSAVRELERLYFLP